MATAAIHHHDIKSRMYGSTGQRTRELEGNLRDRPHERPILQGFAFLAAGSAHGSISNSLAISFASRVV